MYHQNSKAQGNVMAILKCILIHPLALYVGLSKKFGLCYLYSIKCKYYLQMQCLIIDIASFFGEN
jgi:hypothetical protein